MIRKTFWRLAILASAGGLLGGCASHEPFAALKAERGVFANPYVAPELSRQGVGPLPEGMSPRRAGLFPEDGYIHPVGRQFGCYQRDLACHLERGIPYRPNRRDTRRDGDGPNPPHSLAGNGAAPPPMQPPGGQ